MGISEAKKKIVIDNYFKVECDMNTSIKEAFTKGFELGLKKAPQPKTGHWILTDDDCVYCSECEDSYYARPIDASWYYCPHCGAKMESEE